MKLSIIIVNYNVKFFLEHCLHSLEKAISNCECEVFVVDNHSVDDSCSMLKNKFPWVKLIENKKNLGFAKANNQAIRQASGEYVLLLNPDTVVQEDTLDKCIHFMDQHPDAGGLGVKMIDGKGHFLPESKRGLPTPRVAFFKISGLSRLFPRSRFFNRYHLGHLDENEVHQVEILPGAFMMLRKSVLDKTGLLDESFFMYGEDIDLSYRIINAGYKNYYFPETLIIHYKGESTKKGSINYVKVFYKAMAIFAEKHFSMHNARVFIFLINLAIWFRASVAIIHRVFNAIVLPLLDGTMLFGGFYLIKPFWELYKFQETGIYPPEFLMFMVPVYVLIWLVTLYFSGGYDRPLSIGKVLRGLLLGTMIILLIYALLPEGMRYSRALILLGMAWGLVTLPLLRWLFHLTGSPYFQLNQNTRKRILVVGKDSEYERIRKIVERTRLKIESILHLAPDEMDESNGKNAAVEYLQEVIKVNKINEIVFSGIDLPTYRIIHLMLSLSDPRIDFKIAPPESYSVIGSNSINSAGDLYILQLNSIAKPENRRYKRIFDLVLSFIFLLFSPILMWFYHKPFLYTRNIFWVFLGRYSFVGYYESPGPDSHEVPVIRKGVLTPIDGLDEGPSTSEIIERANIIYAKDYRVFNDIRILFNNLQHLDRNIEN